LAEHDIYVQSINYPTVARGEERLRITVTPRHTLEQQDRLVRAVDQIFTELGINRLQDWKRLGGRAGVGLPGGTDDVEPMWDDVQLGLVDGTTPKTLRNGEKAYVDALAVEKARGIFDNLLGAMKGPLLGTRSAYSAVKGEVGVGGGLKMKAGPGLPLEQEIPAARPLIAATA
jgi:5-aminolevulinate synthase